MAKREMLTLYRVVYPRNNFVFEDNWGNEEDKRWRVIYLHLEQARNRLGK